MGTWLKSTYKKVTMYYYVGEWKVGGYHKDGQLFKPLCMLPGSRLSVSGSLQQDAESAMQMVEKEVEYWIKKAGLR